MPKNPFEAIFKCPQSRGSEGMDNPVSGSSQFVSTMTKPLRNLKRRNPLNFDSSVTMPQFGGVYTSFRPCDRPMIRREGRKFQAKWFRHDYIYGSSKDRKTCIWSCDGDSWLDKSSGITWVGVHGLDSICVVSRTGDLDIKRVRGNLKKHTTESFLHDFRKAVISEIEDLADPSGKIGPDLADPPNKLRQTVGQSIKKPFGIVSVGIDEASNDDYEENKLADLALASCERILECVKKLMPHTLPVSAQRDEKNTIKFLQEKMETDITFTINETVQALENDEERAIKFLREKMESDVVFTMDETIQAAISAFQHLFGKTFKANEIGVTVMDPDYNVSELEAKYNDVNAKELEIHDIEKHLAAINEPGCGGSSGSGNLGYEKAQSHIREESSSS